MILKLEVDSGATFLLDKEQLTWDRWMNGKRSHGKLYAWPHEIEIGKAVTIFNTNSTTRIGQAFTTSKVKRIENVKRDEPDIAPAAAASI